MEQDVVAYIRGKLSLAVRSFCQLEPGSSLHEGETRGQGRRCV